jgi:hypothetical protein
VSPSLGYNGPIPRVATFSGDSKECSYAQWRYEVNGLIHDGVPEVGIFHAIRRSVKGMAASMLIQLGETASLTAILAKFDRMFGNILSVETLLEKFYSAKQTPAEDVTAWACRLENLRLDVRVKDPTLLTSDDGDHHIAKRFWGGLANPNIYAALRHKIDTGVSFNDILVAARAVELELSNSKKVAQSHQLSTSEKSAFDQLLARIDKLENAFQSFSTSQHRPNANSKFQGKSNTFKGNCYRCKKYGHKKDSCPLLNCNQPL